MISNVSGVLTLVILIASVIINVALATKDIPYKDIKKVHIVSSNHFDAGFADFTVSIINEYFNKWFPGILTNAADFKAKNTTYVFMTQPWLVWLYTHCKPDIAPSADGHKMQCPTPDEVNKFVAAIKDGTVTWHSFPTNGELSLLNDAGVQVQTQFVHTMDDEFGVPRKICLSQKDVPGIPAGAIPGLTKQGVKAVAVGVNAASAPPAVPSVFVWKNPVDPSQQIYGMWHPGGYGSGGAGDVGYVEGWDTVLYTYWRGDNSGPGPSADAFSVLEKLQKAYPNAQVLYSTFDAFFSELAASKASPPVVTSEIGDNWIWGVASDPMKLQLIRQLNREIESQFSSQKWNPKDPVTQQFVQLYAKSVEHTWGLDYKSFLNDTVNWNNDKFNQVRNNAKYTRFISGWVEQREFLKMAFQTLHKMKGDSALEGLKELELANMGIWSPATESLKSSALLKEIPLVDDETLISCGNWEIGFAPTGEVTTLTLVKEKITIFDAQHPLQYSMITNTSDDMVRFYTTYGFICNPQCPGWFSQDFGKMGLSSAKTVSAKNTPSSANLVQGDQCSFKVTMKMDSNLYGPPASASLAINLFENSTISMLFNLNGKVATRLPEAHWLHFPIVPANSGKWYINKVGQDYPFDNVVVNGSVHMHGHMTGAKYVTPSYTLNINSVDTGLVSVGVESAFPLPLNKIPDPSTGVYFNLMNNVWGTNYVQWYPFLDTDSNLGFRFVIDIKKNQ